MSDKAKASGRPNPPRLTIEDLDEPREFVLDFGTYCYFEEATDVAWPFFNPLSARHLRGMLWAGFKRAAEIDERDFGLTPKDVGGMLDVRSAGRVMKQLKEARDAAMPERDEENPTTGATESPQPSPISG